MNRAFLEGLGLEEEAINKIMAEHGRTVQTSQTLSAQVTELTTQTNDLQTQLATSQTELAEAQSKIAKNESLETELKQSKLNVQLLGENAKSKYLEVLSARLVDVEEDKIAEEIAKLKTEMAELFEVAETPPNDKRANDYQVVDNKLAPGDTPKSMTVESIMAIEDKRERQTKIAENLHLFK